MMGKKVLWFIASTLVSFVVFAAIAWIIQLGIVRWMAAQRLRACEGQSVITEGQIYDSTITSLEPVIDSEERLWQAQGITSYCVEMNLGGFGTSITTVALVQNGEVNRDVSNCFDTFEGYTGELNYMCRGRFVALDYGVDYFTIDSLFDTLRAFVESPNNVVRVTFDPTYHFPTSISAFDPTRLDAWGYDELVAFVPLQ